MKTIDIKKIAAVSALGLVTLFGSSQLANAQNRDNRRDDRQDERQERKIDKQREKIQKQRAKIEQERIRAEQIRHAEWNRRNVNSGNDRSNGNGYYNGNANANTNRNHRYRVNRNGSYYNTDQRGVDLLRQAVNAGYQQGFQAARNDRNRNRRGSYSTSNVYQSGTYGYQSYVSQSQYQYYFRQGFQRGYQDGSNTRYQNDYDGQYQYGYNNNGSMSILGTILSQILNIQQY
jgi:hypothetical protein